MAEMEFELTVSCAECGSKLTINKESFPRTGEVSVTVEPCQKCMSAAEWYSELLESIFVR